MKRLVEDWKFYDVDGDLKLYVVSKDERGIEVGKMYDIPESQIDPTELNLVPNGGTTGQALKKYDDTDGGYSWQDTREVPTGGTQGQVMTKGNDSNFGWEDLPFKSIPLISMTIKTDGSAPIIANMVDPTDFVVLNQGSSDKLYDGQVVAIMFSQISGDDDVMPQTVITRLLDNGYGNQLQNETTLHLLISAGAIGSSDTAKYMDLDFVFGIGDSHNLTSITLDSVQTY